jgi:TonB family protein
MAVVSIPSEGEYLFGSEKVRREDLPRRVRDALSALPAADRVVDLRVGAAVRYGTVRDALAMLRETGHDRVRPVLIRDEEEGEDLQLPAARVSDGVGFAPDALVVEVKPGGDAPKVAVNRREMAQGELRGYLARVVEQRPGATSVFFLAPKDAVFDDAADAMFQIGAAGADLFLLTDDVEVPREVAPAPPPPRSPVDSNGGGVPRTVPPSHPAVERRSNVEMMSLATRRVDATQPPVAESAGIRGDVTVEVTVDQSGRVVDARAVFGHPLLRDAAVRAALQWRFAPPQSPGRPVMVVGEITITFRRF